jgi:hypothetical protein
MGFGWKITGWVRPMRLVNSERGRAEFTKIARPFAYRSAESAAPPKSGRMIKLSSLEGASRPCVGRTLLSAAHLQSYISVTRGWDTLQFFSISIDLDFRFLRHSRY